MEELTAASYEAGKALSAYQEMWNKWRQEAKAQVTEYRETVRKEVVRLEKLSATLATLVVQLNGMDALVEAMAAPPNMPGTVGSQVTCVDTDETVGMPPELRSIAPALHMLVQPQRMSGVYFLVRGATVVYVGQSVNVAARVASHSLDKDYERVFFLKVPPKQLTMIEAAFIRMLRPKYNKSCPEEPSRQDQAKEQLAVAKLVSNALAAVADAVRPDTPADRPPPTPPPVTPSPSKAA